MNIQFPPTTSLPGEERGGRKELSAVEISVGGYSIVLPWATTCGYQVARVVELANTGLISENERVEAIAV